MIDFSIIQLLKGGKALFTHTELDWEALGVIVACIGVIINLLIVISAFIVPKLSDRWKNNDIRNNVKKGIVFEFIRNLESINSQGEETTFDTESFEELKKGIANFRTNTESYESLAKIFRLYKSHNELILYSPNRYQIGILALSRFRTVFKVIEILPQPEGAEYTYNLKRFEEIYSDLDLSLKNVNAREQMGSKDQVASTFLRFIPNSVKEIIPNLVDIIIQSIPDKDFQEYQETFKEKQMEGARTGAYRFGGHIVELNKINNNFLLEQLINLLPKIQIEVRNIFLKNLEKFYYDNKKFYECSIRLLVSVL